MVCGHRLSDGRPGSHPNQPRWPSGWLGAHAWTPPSRPPIPRAGPAQAASAEPRDRACGSEKHPYFHWVAATPRTSDACTQIGEEPKEGVAEVVNLPFNFALLIPRGPGCRRGGRSDSARQARAAADESESRCPGVRARRYVNCRRPRSGPRRRTPERPRRARGENSRAFGRA